MSELTKASVYIKEQDIGNFITLFFIVDPLQLAICRQKLTKEAGNKLAKFSERLRLRDLFLFTIQL